MKTKTQQVLEIGREKWWGFRVAEGNGILTEETYHNGQWYFPTDNSTQYEKASKRIEAIKNQGIRVSQVIIAHESPKLLCAPKKATKENKSKLILWGAVGLLGVAGVVTAAVLVALVVLYLLIPLFVGVVFMLMIGLGVLIDPQIIVVLEDGSRIEVMRWIE